MLNRTVVYVAGPFRADTPWLVEQNVRNAEAVAKRVSEAGCVPLCPHSMFRFFDKTGTDECWLSATQELLRRCDGIVLGYEWRRSKGTRGELKLAEELGLQIWRSPGEFERWARRLPADSHKEFHKEFVGVDLASAPDWGCTVVWSRLRGGEQREQEHPLDEAMGALMAKLDRAPPEDFGICTECKRFMPSERQRLHSCPFWYMPTALLADDCRYFAAVGSWSPALGGRFTDLDEMHEHTAYLADRNIGFTIERDDCSLVGWIVTARGPKDQG